MSILVVFPIPSACLPHAILLNLITLAVFGEERKLWISILHSYIQIHITSAVADILFSNLLTLCSTLAVRDEIQRPGYILTEKRKSRLRNIPYTGNS